MGMFGALDTAASGATVSRVWLDAIADNVANVNTVHPPGTEPFRARRVLAREVPGGGAEVAGIRLADGQPQLVHDPDHPYADADGNVSRAVVDLAAELTDMLLATRSYQANLAVIDRVREAYRAALQIGSR